MNWPQLINEILLHGDDKGKAWSLIRLAKAVDMSYSSLQRLSVGATPEPKYSDGEKLKSIHRTLPCQSI